MALIRCQDVKLGYEGKVIASEISFTVGEGDYLCIVGENGSGKSTLMKALLGLQSPMGGTVEYGDGLVRTEIGYLPQQTLVQRDFPATVEEIVLSGFASKMGWRLAYNKEEKQQAAANMERIGITGLHRSSYRELSGGQQQRTLLARALCATSKIILLDEPTAGLDPQASEELYDILQKLNEEGISIVMISHDVKEVVGRASHVLHMGSTPLFYGTVSDYMDSDACRIRRRD